MNIKPWDGYDKYRTDWTRYDTNQSGREYGIDDTGTIYYRQTGTDRWFIWCTSKELTRHLRHLENIKHPLTWTGDRQTVTA